MMAFRRSLGVAGSFSSVVQSKPIRLAKLLHSRIQQGRE